jgi:hypothetical protein
MAVPAAHQIVGMADRWELALARSKTATETALQLAVALDGDGHSGTLPDVMRRCGAASSKLMGNPPIPADPAWLHNPAACGTLCSIANAGPINATLIMTPSPI